MSENYVDKVIAIAKDEVGYLEKKSNKDLDHKTKNAGSANYTKYGRDMHKLYPSVMDFPAYWCLCFVSWCFYKAYGKTDGAKLLCGQFDDYTVATAQRFKRAGQYSKTPKVGDLVFFKNSTRICHVGLVYKVSTSKIYTIEGNTSSASGVIRNGGSVEYKSYSKTNSRIDGFAHPKYDTKPTSAIVKDVKETVKTTTKKVTGSSKIDTIKEVQRDFINKKYGYSINVTGKYDYATKKALIKILQIELNQTYKLKLEVDGVFGSETKNAIRTLIKGSKNDVVKVLQAFLVCNGYAKAYVDGDYGNSTYNAVKSYQSKNKLTSDGKAGKQTFSKLCK